MKHGVGWRGQPRNNQGERRGLIGGGRWFFLLVAIHTQSSAT